MEPLYLVVIFSGAVAVVAMMLAIEFDVPLPWPLRRIAEGGFVAILSTGIVVVGLILLALGGIDAAIPDD
jgi:hypothetical protein